MKTYTSTGIVYGKLWGGGYGSYPAEKLSNNTKQGLIEEAKKLLKDGGLDSGMGFEYLKGALINIKETETIESNEKEYTHDDYEMEFIGNLTDKEQDFLLEVINNY